MRSTLETALLACADSPWKAKARRFLRGLSCDELEYIAEYLGARILESTGPPECRGFECMSMSADRERKLILVMEYLGRIGSGGGLITRRAD